MESRRSDSAKDAALLAARKAIHDLCLERGSTEGYRDVFAQINVALTSQPPQHSVYSRPECVFNYCPSPEWCEKDDCCQQGGGEPRRAVA